MIYIYDLIYMESKKKLFPKQIDLTCHPNKAGSARSNNVP